jgi:hypothetical protein
VTRPSRISLAAILSQLRQAATKGDRSALTLAVDQMKTWAYSPRYWQKYLHLITHPMARLVDLTVIKQGDKIAHQKGWTRPKREPRKPKRAGPPRRPRRAAAAPAPGSPAAAPGTQPSLFPDV